MRRRFWARLTTTTAAEANTVRRRSSTVLFGSLKVYNFRVWAIGALLGNVGTWMQRVAQDWIVLTVLTKDDGFWVGVVTACQFGPSLLISPLGGLLADRLDRRKALMVTQTLQALTAAGLGALFLADRANLILVCLFALVSGFIGGVEAPFFQTLPGQLVGSRLLTNAVGLNSALFNVARMIGPAVAGLALAVWSPGWVFMANAASFGATVGAFALMRPAEFSALPSVPRAKGQFRQGLRYVAARGDIKLILLVMGVVSCLGLNNQITTAVMARVAFDKGPGEYGILGTVFAVGAVAGSLLAARGRRPRVRTVVVAAAAFGVASTVWSFSPTYEFYAVFGAVVGFTVLNLITAANSALQLSVEPTLRGRVMSLYMVVFIGSTPVGAPLVGWIADQFGPRWSIGVGAVASLAVATWAAIWGRRHWAVSVRVDHWLPPHLNVVNPAAGERRPDGAVPSPEPPEEPEEPVGGST
jgi:MFS family permease